MGRNERFNAIIAILAGTQVDSGWDIRTSLHLQFFAIADCSGVLPQLHFTDADLDPGRVTYDKQTFTTDQNSSPQSPATLVSPGPLSPPSR